MRRIRKDDMVHVLTGKDKGRVGKVIRVFPSEDRVILEGAGVVKRHQKASPTGTPAGIVEKNAKIHISNVMLIDPKTKKPTRVRAKVSGDKKVRVAAGSGEIIDAASKK